MDTSPSEEYDPARVQGLDEALPNRAQDRFDKESFKQIFRDHWNDCTAAHPRYDTPYYDRVIAKMLNCGDPATMGFAQYRCFSCGVCHTGIQAGIGGPVSCSLIETRLGVCPRERGTGTFRAGPDFADRFTRAVTSSCL